MPVEKKKKPTFTVKITLKGNNWDDIFEDLERTKVRLIEKAKSEGKM